MNLIPGTHKGHPYKTPIFVGVPLVGTPENAATHAPCGYPEKAAMQ